MTDATAATTPAQPRVLPEIKPISLREVLPYAIFAVVVGFFLLYLVGLDQGATSLFGGHMIHEFMHDGRHLLGFPCH